MHSPQYYSNKIIDFDDLFVKIRTHGLADQTLVHGITSRFAKDKITGVVGESGSGKSITMRALTGLLPYDLKATYSQYVFDGQAVKGDLSQLPISMIFQESKYSLNPVRKVDFHLLEVIERYRHCSQDEAYDLMLSELAAVGIQAPDRIVQRHPFELTVEERQRIMLCLALLKRPKLLIADEPTTGLDVTIQKEILNLIVDKQAELDLSVVLVTHDLGVVAEICDEIKVMYDGLIVEEGGVEAIFYEPVHRYTQELIKAIPRGINGQHLYTMEKQFLTADEKAGRLAPLDDRDVSPVHRVLKGASEL